VTAQQAADLHRAFLGDLTTRLTTGSFDLILAWALEPDEEIPETDHRSVRQRGGDLGERLFETLAEAARGYRRVGAVGSDHPELDVEEIERGFALLEGGVDIVLGPATDGGYYFLGARAESLRRGLFTNVEWSTARVLEETLERCREENLSVMLLRESSDVDTPADLERLARRLGDPADALSASCPETLALLRQWGAA